MLTKTNQQAGSMPSYTEVTGVFRLYEAGTHAYMQLATVLVIILIPFVLYNVYTDNVPVSLIGGIIIFLLVSNIFMLQLRARVLFPTALITLSIITSIFVAISQLGLAGALWAYPILCTFYFIHDRKIANILTLILLVAITPLVMEVMTTYTMFRYLATLSVTALFANIFLYIIDKQRDSLQKLEVTDPLTGALNRRSLEVALKVAHERKKRHGSNETILMLDIKDFKNINNIYGRERGDQALIDIVTLILSRLRNLDRLYRYAGDDFVLLLTETTANAADRLAGDLKKLIQDSEIINDITISASIGVAELKDNESIQNWMVRCASMLSDDMQK